MNTKEQIFKEDDRVYLSLTGWGIVIDVTDYDVSVKFDTGDVRHISGDVIKLLSFTEYTLEGFSQERPEELPKRGQIVWARDSEHGEWRIGHFVKKENGFYFITGYDAFNYSDQKALHYFNITTENPYENREA